MNTLEQVLDVVNFLGLSHGDFLAYYRHSKCHRQDLWRRDHKGIPFPLESDQRIINNSAMLDCFDHYSRIILSYLASESNAEKYILEHR